MTISSLRSLSHISNLAHPHQGSLSVIHLDFIISLTREYHMSLLVVLAIEDLGTQNVSSSGLSTLSGRWGPLVCLICLILRCVLMEGANELFCSRVQKLAVMINLVDARLSFHFPLAGDVKRSTLNSLQLLHHLRWLPSNIYIPVRRHMPLTLVIWGDFQRAIVTWCPTARP